MKIRTYTQLEAILRTAFDVDENSIKDVAEIANINLNPLYKWNCGAMRFSTDNIFDGSREKEGAIWQIIKAWIASWVKSP